MNHIRFETFNIIFQVIVKIKRLARIRTKWIAINIGYVLVEEHIQQLVLEDLFTTTRFFSVTIEVLSQWYSKNGIGQHAIRTKKEIFIDMLTRNR